jgi:pilus assembly protein CpaB
MRRGRIFIYLALIIILGLVLLYVVWQQYLQPQQVAEVPAPTPVVDTVNVIVVAQRVPRGAAIDVSVLELVPIQRDLFMQGMFTNVTEVEGRLAKFDLDPGIPLTSGMLVESAAELSRTGSTAALNIPRGMVAVSIPINRLSSISYAPRPGDHVNVIVTMLFADLDTDFQTLLPNQAGLLIAPGTGETEDTFLTVQVQGAGEVGSAVGKGENIPGLGQSVYSVPSEIQRPRMVSQNLLQDAIVLQVGTFSLEGEEEAAVAQTEEEQALEGEEAAPAPPSPPEVITLIVTPQDAITLNYLLYSGAKMNLALRSGDDDTRVQTEAVTLQFLLDQYNIPVPVKLPYGLQPRVDNLGSPTLITEAQPTPEGQ